MSVETVPFINNLSGSGGQRGPDLHSHEPGGDLHSHEGPGEHGHTHEHLENAGTVQDYIM